MNLMGSRYAARWLPLALFVAGSAAAGGSTCDIRIDNDNDRGAKVFVYKGNDSVAWIDYHNKKLDAGASWTTDCGTDQSQCKLRWRPSILTGSESANIQDYGTKTVGCDDTYSITSDNSGT